MSTARLLRQMIWFLVAAYLVSGCASLRDDARMKKFTKTSSSYGEALVWSHFEAANLYRSPEVAKDEKADFARLKNIKVTQYDVKNMTVSDDGLRIDQQVDIHYFHRDKMIVETLRDQQRWEFDTKKRRWYLKTRLPEFP